MAEPSHRAATAASIPQTPLNWRWTVKCGDCMLRMLWICDDAGPPLSRWKKIPDFSRRNCWQYVEQKALLLSVNITYEN